MSDMRQYLRIIEGRGMLRVVQPASHPPLPGPGEKPWWVPALAKLTRELSGDGWTWTTGGCFAFAEQLQKAYGGKLWGVARLDPDFDEWDTEHAVVAINGVYYDFGGVFDPVSYMAKLARNDKKHGNGPYRREMRPKNKAGWFEDEFLDDRQMRDLLIVLKTGKAL